MAQDEPDLSVHGAMDPRRRSEKAWADSQDEFTNPTTLLANPTTEERLLGVSQDSAGLHRLWLCGRCWAGGAPSAEESHPSRLLGGGYLAADYAARRCGGDGD